MKSKSKKRAEYAGGAFVLVLVVLALSGLVTPSPPTSTSTSSQSTSTGVSTDGIKFSSIIAPFTYGNNFPTPGASFPVQVNNTMQINVIQFWLSDRAYDPNNETVSFVSASGSVMATGTLSLWGPYGKSGDLAAPVQLSSIITLQPSTAYRIAFSPLPSSDNFGCSGCHGVSQDLITEAATTTTGYLGQSQWPIFTLGLMTLQTSTSGLAIHNYGSFTDLFSSAGYQGNTENAVRFYATQTETVSSFQIEAISSDGSNAQLSFALAPDSEVGGSHPVTSSILATSLVTDAQVKANLTANPGSETTGQSTFIKANFGDPTISGGSYYWIVISTTGSSLGVLFARLVNPYAALVINSQNGYSTWGVPADGPSDLSFIVTTSHDIINNAVLGTPKNLNFQQIAQSFIPKSTAMITGVWIQANPAGAAMNVLIETSTNNKPSGTIIAQGKVQTPNTYVGLIGGSFYVPFASPVSVSGGSTYQLVYQVTGCLQASCSSPNYAYVVQMLNPTSQTHYSTYSNGNWVSQSGNMNFVFTSGA